MKKILGPLGLSLCVGITVIGFQNCSQSVEFDSLDLQQASEAVQVPQTLQTELPSVAVTPTEIAAPTETSGTEVQDILCPATQAEASKSYFPESGLGSSPFKDVGDITGQTWVDSEEMIVSGLSGPTTVILSSRDVNTAYSLNGVRTNLVFKKECIVSGQKYDVGLYLALITVKNGDRLKIHIVKNYHGNTEQNIVVRYKSQKTSWKVSTRNYANYGGKNAKGYTYTRCLGNEIARIKNGGYTVQGTSLIGVWYKPGACAHLAQTSPIAKCIEVPNASDERPLTGDCVLFDGLPDVNATSSGLTSAFDFSAR